MIKKLDVDFINGNIIQSLIIFAIPVFISNVFQQLYNTTDTIMEYLNDDVIKFYNNSKFFRKKY